MSYGDWFKRHTANIVKWVVVVTAAITVIFAICSGLSKQITYDQRAADGSADYSKEAASQIEQACIGIPPPKQRPCIYKAATEYRLQASDKQREYEDLAAQQKSALWTGIMGWAALIGMGLSAIGAVLVWVTFRETRRGADAAIASNEIQHRFERAQNEASVLIHPFFESKHDVPDGQNGDLFRMNCTNYGKTQALDVSVTAGLKITRADGTEIWGAADLVESIGNPNPLHDQELHIVTKPLQIADQLETIYAAIRNEGCEISFNGIAAYGTEFGEHITRTFANSTELRFFNPEAALEECAFRWLFCSFQHGETRVVTSRKKIEAEPSGKK